MPRAVKGVLVQCDPSIKAIILKIDERAHEIVIEDLDESTLMVKENKLADLKLRLDQELGNTMQTYEESGSE